MTIGVTKLQEQAGVIHYPKVFTCLISHWNHFSQTRKIFQLPKLKEHHMTIELLPLLQTDVTRLQNRNWTRMNEFS